jgi:hypothetical protein
MKGKQTRGGRMHWYLQVLINLLDKMRLRRSFRRLCVGGDERMKINDVRRRKGFWGAPPPEPDTMITTTTNHEEP